MDVKDSPVGLSQRTELRVPPLGEQRIQQAISRLQALPAFYPTVQKALRLLGDPLANNNHIQQVICSDPGLSARLLKLANSAYFGFYSQVRTISLAVALIGREKVSTLLRRSLAEELMRMLSGYRPAAAQIREMSQATATAAHMLAERLLRSDKEEMLLAGLLHNVGDLVLLSQFRDSYDQMLRLSEHVSRAEAERAIFGVASATVGKWLLEAWNFPPFFQVVADRHADPCSICFPEAPVAALVLIHTAHQLAVAWTARLKAQAAVRLLSPRLLSVLEIDQEFLLDIYIQLPGEIERGKRLLE